MTDNTEQKEQFEGVRAEVLDTHRSNSKTVTIGHGLRCDGLDSLFAASTDPEIAHEIANRWNAFPTLQKDLDEILEQSNKSSKIALERGKEITRLKEELVFIETNSHGYFKDKYCDEVENVRKLKEELEKEKAKSEVFKKGQDNAHRLKTEAEEARKDDNYKNALAIEKLQREAQDEARKLFEAHEENSRLGPENERLREENERLKGELQCFEGEKELYEESNEDLQSQLSQAQQRIVEFETPKLYHKNEWHEDYGDVIWYSEDHYPPMIESPLSSNWDEEDMVREKYNFFQLMPSLTNKTFEQAQATLKKGE